MNIIKRQERDQKIVEFLCTVVGHKDSGSPIYHTLEEASIEFGLCSTHISRIKNALIGKDVNGERVCKDA